jgi:hypothetical protein
MGGRGRVAFISKMKLACCLAGWPPASRSISNAVGFALTDPISVPAGGECFALPLAGKFLRSAGYSFNRPHPAAYSY